MEDKFYNEDYEKVILACMLMDNTLIDAIRGKINAKCFHNPKAKLIYETIISQYSESQCANILTLSSKLTNFSPADIADITSSISSTENWDFYTDKVRQLYVARKMKTELVEAANHINGNNNTDIITNLNNRIVEYMSNEDDTAVSAKNMCLELPDKILKAYNNMKSGKTLLGYDTGYDQLDEMLDGFQTEKLYILGARPSIGKTAFALNLIANICKHNVPTTVFSLEMSTEQLFYRMIAMLSGLQIKKVQKGFCFATPTGMQKFRNGLEQMFNFPLNIYDRGVDTENDLYAKIRYEAKVNGCKIVFVDHLGLIGSSDPTVNRYIQIGNITKTLHKMAKELDICIVCLCQLAREAEGKEPTLNLLRESGNIEQDADVVMFLHRERDMNEMNVPTNVIVAKQRDGRIGKAEMIFQLEQSKFVEASEFKGDDEVGECPDITEKKEIQNALF